MDKKTIILIIVLSLVLIAAGTAYFLLQNKGKNQELSNQNQVKDLVIEFGKKLQMVSLSASKEIAAQAIKDNYSDFVSPELLAAWQDDSTKAPGRLTSSPWPDRIEISKITKLGGNLYFVQGNVIEITSVEMASGGVAAEYPAAITVEKIYGKWLITDFKKGDYVSLSDKGNSSENATSTVSSSSENEAEVSIEILREGTGEGAKNGDELTVHYIGMLENGTKFDSSYDRGLPIRFILGAGRMIEGWEQGILGMKVGEKRRLTIPPELGYGATGSGGIPPNATIIFEVELIENLK